MSRKKELVSRKKELLTMQCDLESCEGLQLTMVLIQMALMSRLLVTRPAEMSGGGDLANISVRERKFSPGICHSEASAGGSDL